MSMQSPLAGLDLNLLVYLEAVLEERGVTRAGERLRVSQPAVSQALSRLRRHFDDPLLVRNGRVSELTPLARSLYDDVTMTCRLAARVFAAQAAFDPATADREFTVLAADQALAVLGPAVSRAWAGAGPGVRIQFRQIMVDAVAQLDDVLRGVDGFIAPHSIMGDRPELSLTDLAALRWVVSYHNPPRDIALIVRELNARAIDPVVDGVLDSFQSIPFFVAGTDRIACLPRRLAQEVAPLADLMIRPLPFGTPPLAEALWWHPTRDLDPGHRWLRAVLRQASASL